MDGPERRVRRLVVDFADRRPIWRMPDWVPGRIREALPSEWEVAVVTSPTEGSGDGAGEASAEALRAAEGAEVYFGFGVPEQILEVAPGLRWAHTGTAGVGSWLSRALIESDVILTNAAGIHAPPIAETVLAMILHFARGLDFAVRAQARGAWDRSAFDRANAPLREIGESTVGIVGLGGIGRAVAERASALGARVLGLRRRPSEPPPGVELVHGEEGLARILRESHYVVLAAPLTPLTRHMIDRAALRLMRPDAVLVNVSRGALVDEDALVEALREGRIRGAALDVFATEPLPAGHPLWSLPNVLITPHVSGCTHRFWERHAALLVENIGRYLEGRPLKNVVDKRAGY